MQGSFLKMGGGQGGAPSPPPLQRSQSEVQQDECLAEMQAMTMMDDHLNTWYAVYKDCACCKGYIYRCNDELCKQMGQCHCSMQG